jgi:hypothetical protein
MRKKRKRRCQARHAMRTCTTHTHQAADQYGSLKRKRSAAHGTLSRIEPGSDASFSATFKSS